MADKTPTPQKTLNFFDALAAVSSGTKITKLEWNNRDIYILLRNSHLQIHKTDGVFYDLIVTDGDLLGLDWVLIDPPVYN